MNEQNPEPVFLQIDDEGRFTLPPEILRACGLPVGEPAFFDVELEGRTVILRPVNAPNQPKRR